MRISIKRSRDAQIILLALTCASYHPFECRSISRHTEPVENPPPPQPPSNKPQYNISVSRPYRNNPPGPVSNLTNHDFSSISLHDDESARIYAPLPFPFQKKLQHFMHPFVQSSVIVRDKTYHRWGNWRGTDTGWCVVRLKYKARAFQGESIELNLGFN